MQVDIYLTLPKHLSVATLATTITDRVRRRRSDWGRANNYSPRNWTLGHKHHQLRDERFGVVRLCCHYSCSKVLPKLKAAAVNLGCEEVEKIDDYLYFLRHDGSFRDLLGPYIILAPIRPRPLFPKVPHARL